MRLRQLGVAVIASAALAGCAGQGGAEPVGTWGEEADGQPQLVLAEDGTLSGTDGCNRLMGTWEADGDTVTFGETASTRMYCEGVDDWLLGLSSATISGSTMTVLDADGATIGKLEKS